MKLHIILKLCAFSPRLSELWVLKLENSQYLKKVVESMPRRLQAVINGGTTPLSTSQMCKSTNNGPFSGPESYQ